MEGTSHHALSSDQLSHNLMAQRLAFRGKLASSVFHPGFKRGAHSWSHEGKLRFEGTGLIILDFGPHHRILSCNIE